MAKSWELLYLSQDDCVAAGGATMSGTMQATERSFFLHGKGDFIQPGKPVIRWGGPETEETTGRIMSMPSWLGGEQYRKELVERGLLGPVNTAGIKYIPSRPANPKTYGLPRASALIILLDPDTLHPMCVMDGAVASAMRTGAASGVAARYLAREDAQVMGLIGASVQGKTQLAAMKCGVPTLRKCKVFDINPEASRAFAEKMASVAGMEIEPVGSAREAFVGSGVISTATMAREPYVDPEWYEEGAFHAEISFWDTPPGALKVFDGIYVDDWYQVKHHGVDVAWRAVRDGHIHEEAVKGDLGKVVCGDLKGRKDQKERIFFNPIGMGIHDLSEAFRVFTNAREMGLGQTLPLFEEADRWLSSLSRGTGLSGQDRQRREVCCVR
ncbi:MAG: ornithine cyclodeaminase family protein [Synergistales bacterium]|nr:ornithine cyclodeaminase family protein [Synergistales bacterium]